MSEFGRSGGPLPHDRASTEEHFKELEEDLHHERRRARREGAPEAPVVEVLGEALGLGIAARRSIDQRLDRPLDASRPGLGPLRLVDRLDVLPLV
jgi:hypothetical protein